jgi:hypothetical protein
MSDAALQKLEKTVEKLAKRIELLEAVAAIRNLQHAYSYYIDKGQYEEVADLYAEDGEVRFLNGAYKGKEGVRRLYCGWFREYFCEGKNAPSYGLLLDHYTFQDIIHLSPDGNTAKARWRCLLLGGRHESMTREIPGLPEAFWEHGIYENTYVKEDGVWKIKVAHYNMEWQANYAEGPAHSAVHLHPVTKTYPEDPIGPDELATKKAKVWPHTAVIPYHYPHPVTGKKWTPAR